MELKKEVLAADRETLVNQIRVLQGQVQYIDGLILFMDRPEALPETAIPEGGLADCCKGGPLCKAPHDVSCETAEETAPEG